MKYSQIILSEVNTMYHHIAVAEAINKHIFNGDEDGILVFTKSIASEIGKLTPPNPEDYSDDLFKLELCHAIEQVATQEDNVSMFGHPWFSKANIMIKILNLMEQHVNEQ